MSGTTGSVQQALAPREFMTDGRSFVCLVYGNSTQRRSLKSKHRVPGKDRPLAWCSSETGARFVCLWLCYSRYKASTRCLVQTLRVPIIGVAGTIVFTTSIFPAAKKPQFNIALHSRRAIPSLQPLDQGCSITH